MDKTVLFDSGRDRNEREADERLRMRFSREADSRLGRRKLERWFSKNWMAVIVVFVVIGVVAAAAHRIKGDIEAMHANPVSAESR